MTQLSPELAKTFVDMALQCVEREYPNKLAHTLSSDRDVQPPRALTPVFYGCYDWHSAVHGHWMMVRLLRRFPSAAWAGRVQTVLTRHLVAERIEKEVAYLRGEGRASFERPYGLAWLLQLGAELAEWDGTSPSGFSSALRPLELAAVDRLSSWLPKLTHPVRSGEHSQTAFALGLALDWARAQPWSKTARDFALLVEERASTFYRHDRAGPLSYEPSGEDFLSPCLAEADIMRRVMPTPEYVRWFTNFLPPATLRNLRPVSPRDRSDGKLVHLDGLNLSRAWMLYGIASGLTEGTLQSELRSIADMHRDAGLSALRGQRYEGSHFLGSFATYLLTARGLPK